MTKLDIDFEVPGATPEIEVPVKVEFMGKTKPMTFAAVWTREEPADAQQILADAIEKESELDGSALVRHQAEMISERLVAVKGFRTLTGKKIDAGEGFEYELDSLLEELLTVRSYHSALYKSMFNSLAERDMFEAKRKN